VPVELEDRFGFFGATGARRVDVETQPGVVEQEDLDFLGALGVEVDVDDRQRPGGALEHVAHEVGAPGLEPAHHFGRSAAHAPEPLGVVLVLVFGGAARERFFDRFVGGQHGARRQPELLDGLALGERIVSYAFVVDEPRGKLGDLFAGVERLEGAAAGHGRSTGCVRIVGHFTIGVFPLEG